MSILESHIGTFALSTHDKKWIQPLFVLKKWAALSSSKCWLCHNFSLSYLLSCQICQNKQYSVQVQFGCFYLHFGVPCVWRMHRVRFFWADSVVFCCSPYAAAAAKRDNHMYRVSLHSHLHITKRQTNTKSPDSETTKNWFRHILKFQFVQFFSRAVRIFTH